MKCLMLVLCLLVIGQGAVAQLVVFDNSHAPGHEMYDAFKAHLTAWGYAVEARTTPLTDNGDADVIVILPQDAYTDVGDDYTAQEAAWLMDFVDSGKGLFAGLCPSELYTDRIAELMAAFGVVQGDFISNPAFYRYFTAHPLFADVAEMGDTMSYCVSMDVSSPSVPVATDGLYDYVAVYEPDTRHDGAAVWVSQYKMAAPDGLYDYDNLRFLGNAFAWLSNVPHVVNEDASWGDVKRLFE